MRLIVSLLAKLARVPCLRGFVAYPADWDYIALPSDNTQSSHPVCYGGRSKW